MSDIPNPFFRALKRSILTHSLLLWSRLTLWQSSLSQIISERHQNSTGLYWQRLLRHLDAPCCQRPWCTPNIHHHRLWCLLQFTFVFSFAYSPFPNVSRGRWDFELASIFSDGQNRLKLPSLFSAINLVPHAEPFLPVSFLFLFYYTFEKCPSRNLSRCWLMHWSTELSLLTIKESLLTLGVAL